MFAEIPAAMATRMHELEARDADERRRGLPAADRLCQVPPETGRLLALLAAAAPAGEWLEVGTSAGYSTLWLALAARATGRRVRTLERAEWKLALARETFAQVGVEDVVELVAGDAREALAEAGPIGFCFLDAAKSEHADYYALAVPRLLPGGLLVADNIASHAEALAPFVANALADPRLDVVVLGVGKGLLIGRRT